MRLLAICLELAAMAMGAERDGAAILVQVRTAYLENQQRERHWNWTTTTTRSIIDKNGSVLEQLPSVTVESPIRSDGKRCNAVLAWGDGREPYLADADADARCTVEQESHALFRLEALLESPQAKIRSRSADAITLVIEADKAAMASEDPVRRCTGSVQATIQVDPVTFFPKHMELKPVGSGCEQTTTAVNHYDDHDVSKAVNIFRKGSIRQLDYVLQKASNQKNDYWVCIHRHEENPLRDGAQAFLMWGRRFELASTGGGRRSLGESTTVASELAADVMLKFETGTLK